MDDYIKELKKEGYQVKAFIHCNPNNPLGDVYGEETTLNLMRVCKEHQIHFISDEIYALSIFEAKGRQKFKRQVNFLYSGVKKRYMKEKNRGTFSKYYTA